jgi:hypothetical protein
MNYLDTIKKYGDGRKYAGDTIQTSDGVLAYMTSTGVAKPYSSMDVYNINANKNGCKSTPVLIEPKWSDLGFPVGSQMAPTQSCGNETSYVQSGFPSNDFDAAYYININPDLQGLTEEQALAHWNTYGKKEGRRPNHTIFSSMTTLGKVGYVDVNSQLHSVPSLPTGKYSSSKATSNVIGKKMMDCTPIVRYGENLIILRNKDKGVINSLSKLQFGPSFWPTTLIIRPKVSLANSGSITDPVHYGDEVSITASSDNSNTSSCGWWGCKVATVNSETLSLQFGPGGESGGSTFFISPPRGSVYQVGQILKYGNPFSLIAAVIKPNNILYQKL